MNTRQKGQIGEEIAASYLKGKGLEVLKRNFICPAGEVDIIGKQGDEICFIEVKNWNGLSIEHLEYSVNRGKQRRIINTSKHYLAENRTFQDCRIRYDVVYISAMGEEIRHIPHAFTETGN